MLLTLFLLLSCTDPLDTAAFDGGPAGEVHRTDQAGQIPWHGGMPVLALCQEIDGRTVCTPVNWQIEGARLTVPGAVEGLEIRSVEIWP